MHLFFYTLILIFSPANHPQFASEIDGNWSGAIEVFEQDLSINIIFSFSDGMLDGTIDIPQQNLFNLPVEVLELQENLIEFQFQTGTGQAVFRGHWYADDGIIEGDYEEIGQIFPFRLEKEKSSSGSNSNLPERDIIIPTESGQISGSLMLQEEPASLIILLSGTGSQGRNETVAGFRVFGELSSELFDFGYSSFRYDDPGVGQSEGIIDATLPEMANDLKDIIGYLHENYENQFTNLVLLGHSQGGLVASIAAREAAVSAIIFMGSPFLRGDLVINEQIRLISEERDIPDEVLEMNLEFQKRIYDVVRTDGDWQDIEEDLAHRLEEQINQLPTQQRDALGDMSSFINSQIERQLSTAKSRWFKSLIELEPADVITISDLPMLAIFGELDTEIPPSSNKEAAERIRSENNLNLEIEEIEEANHFFQQAITGSPSEYGMLENDFAEGFIDAILDFLDQI